MIPTVNELIVWLIVGALAGSLVGMVVKRQKSGFGWLNNLGVGLVGDLVGGLLFNLFSIAPGLGKISISLEDLVSAFVGSLLFLVVLGIVRWWRKTRRPILNGTVA